MRHRYGSICDCSKRKRMFIEIKMIKLLGIHGKKVVGKKYKIKSNNLKLKKLQNKMINLGIEIDNNKSYF